MIGIVECFTSGLIAASVIISTLQASSRVLHAVSQEDAKVMDGPLILSPDDVNELEKNGSFASVSPLWEVTHGFRMALALFSDSDQSEDSSNPEITKTSWKQEFDEDHLTNLISFARCEEEKKSLLNDCNNIDVHIEKETKMILAPAIEDKSTISIISFNPFRNISILLSKIIGNCKVLISKSEIFNALLQIDPVIYLEKVREYKKIKDVVENTQVTKNNDSMDFDSVLTMKINLPCDTENSFSESEGKVAIIRAFAPQVFQQLRSRFGISETDFTSSLLRSGPFVSFQSNSKGAARAGGFFFFSRDGAYMVKTIKPSEVKTVREMLPKYFFFMKRNAKRSLLTRFCGLYSVQLLDESGKKSGDECMFLIMNSVFPAKGSKFITERFDLKGSTVGRECSAKERAEKGSEAVLKDLDLQREVEVMKSIPQSFGLSNYGISIGPKAKSALMNQLRKDLKLLVSCSVMDYSLLVGVVNMESKLSKKNETLISLLKKMAQRFLRRVIGRYYTQVCAFVTWLLKPLLHLLAPAIFVCQMLIETFAATFSSIINAPFPYYGVSLCGIDGGELSMLTGSRLGHRALYYLGVIDFLQPWTTQKVLEKEIKGLIGYEKAAISCAHPEDYAERFLDFMDKHIT